MFCACTFLNGYFWKASLVALTYRAASHDSEFPLPSDFINNFTAVGDKDLDHGFRLLFAL